MATCTLKILNFTFRAQNFGKNSFLIIFTQKSIENIHFCCSMVLLVLCFYFFTFLNANQYFLDLFTALSVILVQHSWSMIIVIWIFQFFGFWTNLSLRQSFEFFLHYPKMNRGDILHLTEYYRNSVLIRHKIRFCC